MSEHGRALKSCEKTVCQTSFQECQQNVLIAQNSRSNWWLKTLGQRQAKKVHY